MLLEEFALAEDRAKVLENLIPGTQDYYYYHCLHAQHEGRLDEVPDLVATWIDRHRSSSRTNEILNRQALLVYERDAEAGLKELEDRLGVRFNHQREVERTTDYPTRLDPARVGKEAFWKEAWSHSSWSDLSGFSDAALDELMGREYSEPRRLRSLLQRVTRPDHPSLVQRVLEELADERSGGFGSLPIHELLLRDQLDALARARPELLKDARYVHAYLRKLQPGADVEWEHRPEERLAYLDRLWTFVRPLVPAFNGLKLNVLYHRLQHDRAQGVHDRDRFLEYLRIPHHGAYVEPKYLKREELERWVADFGSEFASRTGLPTVGDAEPLVRELLSVFFREAGGVEPFDTYIRSDYLREVFATTKILAGVGDMEAWYSMLDDPGKYQALKDRVDIEFAPTNPAWFAAEASVALDLFVKNVPTLVVKVFEINTLNHFLTTGKPVDTTIDLDGLVAREEQTHTYDEPALRRVRRSFAFPGLDRPGVFVVEFIGGGRSSRALIRKGSLRFVERVGAAGHVFRVLDEQNRHLSEASLWMGGREYRADREGAITIPFTNTPRRQKILLRHGALTAQETFQHQAERYQLSAGIYVDRESLLAGQQADVVVRPTLWASGTPAALSLVEDVVLAIDSTDRHGVNTSLEVPGFELCAERASVHTFKVPADLARIGFTVRGRVRNLSADRSDDVSASRSYSLNGIDTDNRVADLHLGRTADGYVLYVLGKSGEPRGGQALEVTLRHREVVPTIRPSLQTDAQGRVELGQLPDITSVEVSAPAGSRTWSLTEDGCRLPSRLHGQAGETLRVPLPRDLAQAAREEVSLLERRGATFVHDRLECVKIQDGCLELSGLPPGDHDLLLKRSGQRLEVRVAEGTRLDGWVLGQRRMLETRGQRPLAIAAVRTSAEEVAVRVVHATSDTRVHLVASRFLPAHDLFAGLSAGWAPAPDAVGMTRGLSSYVSGRDIGDEYRYILERKRARRYPGNMLTRPGLLLNPWAMRKTSTGLEDARGGGGYVMSGAAPARAPMAKPAPAGGYGGGGGSEANLDFLPRTARVASNLEPDEEGWVRVPRAELAGLNLVRVVAIDPRGAVLRHATLPEATDEPRDLRLILGLDPNEHFTEKKQVSALQAGDGLAIDDITTTKLEVYGTLARVYSLYATISGDADLEAFGFLTRWPELDEEEQRAKYSEFACHELSFFLSQKDPAFFEGVIRPYLRNKKDKTFMDRYLLGDDLAAYRAPWAHAQLNVVERILLGRRIAAERPAAARLIGERCDLLPRDVEREGHLFGTALASSALDTDDALGFAAAATEVAANRMLAEKALLGGASSGKKRKRRSRSKQAKEEAEPEPYEDETSAFSAPLDEFFADEAEEGADDDEYMRKRDDVARDVDRRREAEQFYRKLETTQELGENNYYHLPVEEHTSARVTENAFWRDYAEHPEGRPFLSAHLAEASRNFTEMVCALAVLDLPFDAKAPETAFEGAQMRLSAGTPCVVFHEEIKPSAEAAEQVPVLVSQNYFRQDDRYRHEGNETFDKYVAGEFLVHTVYLCQVVLTNPTSSRHRLDLLLQIPRGALPVQNGFQTRGVRVDLHSYATHTIEYAFYFPAPGEFPHFPVHVAKNQEMIAAAAPRALEVVEVLSEVDTTSWPWISQHAEPDAVIRFLEEQNLERIELSKIAWRMKDRAFFLRVLSLLAARHRYDHTLWSYGIHHHDPETIREYLLYSESFLRQTGRWLDVSLVRIDPVARRWYEHREYAPLVNARAHPLGGRRTILNDRFSAQYQQFLELLKYKPRLDPDDLLALSYYLLLQDRVEEGLAAFARVDPAAIETRLQHDYLSAYVAFYGDAPQSARSVALRHRDHPVDRWRNLFRNVSAQLDELSGEQAAVVDAEDRTQSQTQRAAGAPSFEFSVEDRTVKVHHQNLARVQVNYYLMDIELLFSRQPFVQQQADHFSFITPNRSDQVALTGAAETAFELPAEYQSSNVIVELVGEGRRQAQAYYAHSLRVQLTERFGQVQVRQQGSGDSAARVYVKVYARGQDGVVRFYKDGYTDHRGRFDYTSLSTNELDRVERFALLILSEEQGAVIREAAPPKR